MAKHCPEGIIMYAYCLFCQTQKCKYIASVLEQKGVLRAFSPQIIKRQRIQGANVDKQYDLLPGYVFVYSETEMIDNTLFYRVDGLIRRLGTVDNRFALEGGDLDFALHLYEKNGIVGQVTVFKIGDQVRLDDPLFNGCSGTITEMDYRKERAKVSYRFAGMNCFTWVACRMIAAKET